MLKYYAEQYKSLILKKELAGASALKAVKLNAYALQYVNDQTEEICWHAVKQDGYALQYVNDQTEKICLEAVKQDGYALKYVKDQTEEICLEALKQNGFALQYVTSSFFPEIKTVIIKGKEFSEDTIVNALKQYSNI